MNGPVFLIPIFAVAFGIPFVVAPLARAIAKRIEGSARKPDREIGRASCRERV